MTSARCSSEEIAGLQELQERGRPIRGQPSPDSRAEQQPVQLCRAQWASNLWPCPWAWRWSPSVCPDACTPTIRESPTSVLARWLSASTRMVTSTPQTPRRNGLRASARSEASDVQQKLLCADRVQHAGEHAQPDLEDRKRARISHLSAADRLNTPGLRQRIPTVMCSGSHSRASAEGAPIIPPSSVPDPRWPLIAGLAGRVISVRAARCLLLRAVLATQQEVSVHEFTGGTHPSAIPTNGPRRSVSHRLSHCAVRRSQVWQSGPL
jgi:hypothetical protein